MVKDLSWGPGGRLFPRQLPPAFLRKRVCEFMTTAGRLTGGVRSRS